MGKIIDIYLLKSRLCLLVIFVSWVEAVNSLNEGVVSSVVGNGGDVSLKPVGLGLGLDDGGERGILP